MSASSDSEILNIEEAAARSKTFNKVLHSEDIPGPQDRPRVEVLAALIDWVGRGSSTDYYREDKSRAGRQQSRRRGLISPPSSRSSPQHSFEP